MWEVSAGHIHLQPLRSSLRPWLTVWLRDFYRDDQGFARRWYHSPPTLGHILYCFPSPFSPTHATAPSLLSCSLQWELARSSDSRGLLLPSSIPSFFPLSPDLSPFLPPWSCYSCFIATMLCLHNQPQTQRWPQPQKVRFRLSHESSYSHALILQRFKDTPSAGCPSSKTWLAFLRWCRLVLLGLKQKMMF